MGVVASAVLAMQALGAAAVEAGAGLAGGGGTSRAGGSSHANISGNSCAKLDTPKRMLLAISLQLWRGGELHTVALEQGKKSERSSSPDTSAGGTCHWSATVVWTAPPK